MEEKLWEILRDLEMGKIACTTANDRILRLFNVVGQSEQCILHSTDWNGKCFKCGEQVFVREPK